MNYREAREKFRAFVFEERGVVVYETNVIVRSFGWVFYYQSELFFETADALDGIMGNNPVFVSKQGEIRCLHPTLNVEAFLDGWDK